MSVPTAPFLINLEQLAQRMVALEDQAYQDFADHFGRRFRTLFLHQGLGGSDAEDLAVSCISDIALKVDRYRPGAGAGGFAGWVFTLARNAVIDWLRRHRPTVPLLEQAPAPSGPDSDQELYHAVWEALAQLSPDDQAIIRLRDLERECSYAEIGEHLGIQTGAARTRHSRALHRLASLLDRDPRVRAAIGRGAEPDSRRPHVSPQQGPPSGGH